MELPAYNCCIQDHEIIVNQVENLKIHNTDCSECLFFEELLLFTVEVNCFPKLTELQLCLIIITEKNV